MNQFMVVVRQEYTYATKKTYDEKRKITPQKLRNMKNKFKIGNKVLYYIGDKKVSLYKWRQYGLVHG